LVFEVASLLGPAGIAVLFATPTWLAAVGIVLVHRSRAELPTKDRPTTTV